MARQGIFTGSSPNDGTGDSLLVGASKINQNFSEIYSAFGNGNNLESYVSSSGISTVSQGLTGTPNITANKIVAGLTSSIIPFLWEDYVDLPSFSSYHGAFAHVHETGKAYYAHTRWVELVNTETDRTVGTGTENYNVGVITATSFFGDGSQLTGIVGSGSGVIVKDSGSIVGTAGTIDFGNNLTVSPISAGVVTVTGSASGGESYWTSNPAGIHTFSNVGIGTTNPPADLSVYGDVFVSGFSTFTNNVYIKDSRAAIFGDNSELQIFNDGLNSYIDNFSTNNLVIRDDGIGIQFRRYAGSPSAGLMAAFNVDAGVELYYGGVLKFQTFQNGVAINESVGIGSTASNPPYRLTVSGVGATITQGLENAIADFTSSVNGYGQVNVRNSLSGTNASGDIVVTANSGTDISNFIDLGINNSGFTTTSWTINGPLDGYLYTSDGNLSIGAVSASKYLSLFAGGTLAANEQVRVTSTGVGIGTTNITSRLTVGGDVRVSGVITATSFSGITTSMVVGLSTVSSTGSYNSLINKPTIPVTINDLSDVNAGAPSTGQVLKWSGMEWEAASDLTASGGIGIGLSDLSVTINPAGINSLTYNNATGVFLFTPTSLVGYTTTGYVTTQIGLNTFTGAASTITSGQISNWNTAYSWGNHASVGYLTDVNITAGSNITVLETSEGNFIITSTAVGTGAGTTWSTNSAGIHTTKNVGIGTTLSSSTLTVEGNGRFSGVVTATTFVGSLTGTATSTTNIPNLVGNIVSIGNNTSLGTITPLDLRTALTSSTGTGDAVFATSPTFATPALGTPASGTLTNCTFPTLNQNTTGTSGGLTGTPNITVGVATASNFRTNSTVGNGSDVGFAIKYYLTSSGSSAYLFAGPGLVNTTNNPTLYLHRGFTYIFENSTGGAHPFAIRYSSGGTGYGSTYLSGSQSGTQVFTVPFDAPATLVYQCTIHSGMLGTFNIVT